MQSTRASTPLANNLLGVLGRLVSRRAAGRTSTPARLRTWQVLTVVGALLFALFGAYGINRRAGQLRDARHAADHLIAVQDIGVAVVQADAIASSSYLAGGQEDPTSRTEYLTAIDQASNQLVAVANGVGDADANRLAEASRLLGSYVGLIEQARANNRQGFPVGAAYQREANALVSDDNPDTADTLSVVRRVEESLRHQVNASLRSAHRAGAWFNAIGWILLAAVALGGLWLAGRFRRLVNVPLAVAGLLLLVLLLVGGAQQATAMTRSDDAVTGAVHTADLAAQARAAAFDARSQEALTLINRGNGQANEQRWQEAAATVHAALDGCRQCGDAQKEFASYADLHEQLRKADDGGKWDDAVAMSLGKDTDLKPAFESFAQEMAGTIKDNAAAADRRISDAASSLGALRIVTLLGGLAVAALVVAGYGQRLKEYR